MNPTRGYNSPGMMLRLRHHRSGRLPTSRLIDKALVLDQWLAGGPAHWARQQFGNISFQVVVGRNPDGIFHAPLLQSFVNLRLGKGGIGPKGDFLPHLLLALDLGQQNLFPAFSTVNVAGPELGRQTVPVAVEQQ